MSPEFLPARICRNNPGAGNQSPPPGLEPLNKISLGWVSEVPTETDAEVTLKGSSCQCVYGGGLQMKENGRREEESEVEKRKR